MKIALGILAVLICAGSTAAVAESAAPSLLSELPEITQRLAPNADQKSQIEALLHQAEPEMRRLTEQESALNTERQNLQTSIYRDLNGLFPEGQYAQVASESQRSRAETIFKEYEPRLSKAQNDADAVEKKIEKLRGELLSGIAALLNPEQKQKIDDLKAALAEKRYAQLALAHLQGLAENSEVLGDSYKRVRAAEAARGALIAPWMAAWKDKDLPRFELLLSRDFKGSSWSNFSLKRQDHIAKEYRPVSSEILDRNQALASVGKWLGEYQKIEGCDLDLFGAKENGGETRFEGRISVRGINAAERKKMETSASVRLTVVKEGAREVIKTIELSDARMVVAVKDSIFENATAEYGLDRVPNYLRTEAIRRGGYALAVNRDRDGTSLYVGSVKGATLLRRTGSGSFVDVTKESGLGDDPLVKTAIFADFNNDGREDLLVDRFQTSHSKEVLLYEGLGNGKFRQARNFDFERMIMGRTLSYAMPMAVGDFNGDQKLDVYVGFPGKKDFTTMGFEKSALDPLHPYPQGLFINKGNFDFIDRTNYAFYNGVPDVAGLPFPHAAVAVDLNGDGKTDIVVVDDRQNNSPIYMNRGAGIFEQDAEKMGVHHAHWGMSAAVGDVDNKGTPDLYMTNVAFPAQFLATNDYSSWIFGEEPSGKKTLGNHLYRNKGNGTFEDVTDKAGVRFSGAASGGAVFFDFDNDGYQDLYVVNGLWSAGPQAKSLDDTFILASLAENQESDMLRLFGREDLDYRVGVESSLDALRGRTSAVMSILKTLRTEDGKPLYSLGGDQRNRLFHNNGDGTFTDVAYIAGVDSVSDGYVAAVADLNGDGNLDLLLRNGDPGTDYYRFPAVELFVNRAGQDKKFLELHLSGRESNHDAIGTKVFIEQGGGRKQYRELIANNGAAQDEKLVHFGLNDDESVTRLRVQWPSGRLQTFSDVAAGNYRLIEGAGLHKIESTVTSNAR